MNNFFKKSNAVLWLWAVGFLFSPACADENLTRFINENKFDSASQYADDKLPPASRTAVEWTQIAKADEALNLPEKALACYMVALRLTPLEYDALLGAAKINNKLDQRANAADYAKKALAIHFSPEAACEYARACIKLNKPQDAKKALEKVIEADPESAFANRELGTIYFNDREFAKAIPLLRKSFDIKPDATTALMIGKASLSSGDTAGAMTFFKDAIAKDSALYDANAEMARIYFKMGKFADVIAEYEKIKSKDDFTAMDYYNLAISFEKTKSPDSAFRAYVSAANKFGNIKEPEALHSHADAGAGFIERKNFAAALPFLQTVESIDPQARIIKDIYILLATAYDGLGNRALAVAALEKAIGLDKENIEAYARLADIYETAHEPAKAELVYKRLLSLHPGDALVYGMLGDYNFKLKKFPAALMNYEKAFNLDPSVKSAKNVATGAAALNQWDKALEMYRKIIRLDPQNIEANKRLGMALMKKDSTVSALEYLEAANMFSPRDPEILSALAEGYTKTNRLPEAIDMLEKAKTLKSDDPDIRMRLVKLFEKTGQDTKALEEFKPLLSLKKDDTTVLLMYAKELVSVGNYKDAEATLQAMRETDPENIDALMTLAGAERMEKKYDAAIEIYKDISYIKPDFAPAILERAEVYLLQEKIQWAEDLF